jgi:hypothetical protein
MLNESIADKLRDALTPSGAVGARRSPKLQAEAIKSRSRPSALSPEMQARIAGHLLQRERRPCH